MVSTWTGAMENSECRMGPEPRVNTRSKCLQWSSCSCVQPPLA